MKSLITFLFIAFTFSFANAASESKLAEQAEKYANAIGHAVYISESDSEWTPFYVDSQVSGFNTEEIARALNATAPVEVYSVKLTKDIFDYCQSTDISNEADRASYKALLQAMKKDFKDFRFIKVGIPDSGSMDLYLLGITEDGQLVGLKTISIET
jgi:hypothetical protein